MKLSKYIKNISYDIKSIDFSMLGFRKKSKWVKGRKTESEYVDPETDELIVKKTFTDVIENDEMVGIDILFEWMDDQNNVADSKTQRVYMDMLETGELLRKRRQRAIDRLIVSAKMYDKALADANISQPQTLEQTVGIIFDHYRTEMDKFIETGSDEWKNAMNSETDPQISGILGYVANPANNFTIKDSILFEI